MELNPINFRKVEKNPKADRDSIKPVSRLVAVEKIEGGNVSV